MAPHEPRFRRLAASRRRRFFHLKVNLEGGQRRQIRMFLGPGTAQEPCVIQGKDLRAVFVGVVLQIGQEFPPAVIGIDPRLHSASEILYAQRICAKKLQFQFCENLIDRVWKNQPKPSRALPKPHPKRFAGVDADIKKQSLLKELSNNKADSIILTKPESICWLLNIRGNAIRHFPVVKCFFIFHKTGRGTLLLGNTKISEILKKHLGARVDIMDITRLTDCLKLLQGRRVQLDFSTCPFSIYQYVKIIN